MPVAQIWSPRGWRRGVAVLGAAYCLVAWVLPVAVTVIVRDLPLLQERGFPERLALSAAGSGVLVAAMAAAFPGRFRVYRGSTPWETAKYGGLALLGLAMFTATAAWWSGNTFGVFAKVLPGSAHAARYAVVEFDSPVGRRRSATLVLKPEGEQREVYLALSKWLFDLPDIRDGDALVLAGKRTAAGFYVDSVRRVPRR